MALKRANEKKPLHPISKENFPHNRVFQDVDGKAIKVGSVINVGNVGPNDDWWTLAETYKIRPWEIIFSNFETYIPEEVNWYLREYVGCHVLGPRGKNYRFDNAKPGEILMPWGSSVNKIIIDRLKKKEKLKEKTQLDKRWPDRKKDITIGKNLIKQMMKHAHQQVSEWKPNPYDFDIRKEIKDKIFSPGGPKFGFGDLVEGLVKTFHETDPRNQEIRRVREGIYASFAAGVATVIFSENIRKTAGMSGYERIFFEKGMNYAKKFTDLQKYQFCLAIVENGRMYGLGGYNPITYSKEQYKNKMESRNVARLISQEFYRNKYLFRNTRN